MAYSEKYLSFMVASAAVVVPYMASEAGCPPGWTPGGGDMAPVGDVKNAVDGVERAFTSMGVARCAREVLAPTLTWHV